MKYILILLISCFGLSTVFSQEERNKYLFPDFTKAYVHYKDGRVFNVPLNYHLLSEKFFFIDTDNEKKEFSDPDMIVSIQVGERTFLPVSSKETAEVIQAKPKILLQYRGTKKIKKDLTYGGKTETAAVDSYNNLIYGTGDNESNTFLDKINYNFYIEKNNRLKRFSTKKQFLKIFSHQKEELIRYMDENNMDFESIEQVVKICNHAVSLP